MKGLAYRRHQRQRTLQYAKKVLKTLGHTDDWVEHRAPRQADNLKVCSCDACRNGRRNEWSSGYGRLTIQEKKALDDK